MQNFGISLTGSEQNTNKLNFSPTVIGMENAKAWFDLPNYRVSHWKIYWHFVEVYSFFFPPANELVA